MRLVLKEPPGKAGSVGILGAPWSQAEVLGCGDQVQLLKDPAGHSVVTGVEGERGVEGVCGITQVRDGEERVHTLLPPEVLALPGGNQAVSRILQPSTWGVPRVAGSLRTVCALDPLCAGPGGDSAHGEVAYLPPGDGGDERCLETGCRLQACTCLVSGHP